MATLPNTLAFFPDIRIIVARMSLCLSESHAENTRLLSTIEYMNCEFSYSSVDVNEPTSSKLKSYPMTPIDHPQDTLSATPPDFNPIHPIDSKEIVPAKRSSLVIEELQQRKSIIAAQIHNQFYGDIIHGQENGRLQSHNRAQLLQQANHREGNKASLKHVQGAMSSMMSNCLRSFSMKQELLDTEETQILPLIDPARK